MLSCVFFVGLTAFEPIIEGWWDQRNAGKLFKEAGYVERLGKWASCKDIFDPLVANEIIAADVNGDLKLDVADLTRLQSLGRAAR